MWLFASEVSADYYTHHPRIVSLVMLTITYIQAMALHIHTQGRFNNQTTCSLYRIMVTATSVMGMRKMGNIVPRAGLKPIVLAFQASVLPLPHVGSMMSQLHPRQPAYVALSLRG